MDGESLVDVGGVLVEVKTVGFDLLDDGLDVSMNVSLTVIGILSEFLVEKKILSPFESLSSPGHIFLEHLNEE